MIQGKNTQTTVPKKSSLYKAKNFSPEPTWFFQPRVKPADTSTPTLSSNQFSHLKHVRILIKHRYLK